MSLFGFEIKRYLKGFLLLAIATAVFSLVNIAISTIPDTVSLGGDITQLCSNINITNTPIPTPTPTPTPNITNVNFYDPFNTLNTTYWVSLSLPWTVSSGYVRTTVSDASYNNAIYYVVDFVEQYHDTVRIGARIKIDRTPPLNGDTYRYCVFLSTVDLNTRILGCIETRFYGQQYVYYDVYARIRLYSNGSVVLLRTAIPEDAAYNVITGVRDIALIISKINETHLNITLEGTTRDGSQYSLSPVTVGGVDWGHLGYFGLHMSVDDTGFDFVDVWVMSANATSTVYYNVNFPPPLPVITTTVTETKILELGKDILVIPLGSFVRVLSFGIYIVYIVRTIKHFTPEF